MNTSECKERLQQEVTQICNMCMAMGIHKNVYEGENKLLTHMPVSLYPYELGQLTYNRLRKAHQIWVKLILKVSRDKQFVNKVFAATVQEDNFVERYLRMYNRYADMETYGAACIRVDYMGDEHPQLVEYNLMSVGLNGMGDSIQRLAQLYEKHRTTKDHFYPDSQNQVTFLDAISYTIEQQKLQGIILMIVPEKHQKEFNFGDQNAFVLQALRRKLKVKRLSMTEFIQGYHLQEDNQLYLENQKVAAVYFRTGYSPAHYTTQKHWEMRQAIEKANVLSVPSVSMELVNFKRMQAQLSKMQVLRKYLPQEEALLLKSLTGQLYDFEDPSHIQKLRQLSSTNKYVLKSNRQGGGNNFFGVEAAQKVQQLSNSPDELKKYILQNKIQSKILDNVFIANYSYLQVKECTCEYSTLGAFAYSKGELTFNRCGGHVIRLKRAEDNQGGIAINKAVIAGLCVVRQQQGKQSESNEKK